MGDFNAKIRRTVEDEHLKEIIGRYGIVVRNERGEKSINYSI